MAKQDDYVRYTIRVPGKLYSRLQEVADEHKRSVNAEIIDRLSSLLLDEAYSAGTETSETLKTLLTASDMLAKQAARETMKVFVAFMDLPPDKREQYARELATAMNWQEKEISGQEGPPPIEE